MSYHIPEEYFSVFFNKHFNEYFMQSRIKKYSCPDQTFFSFLVGSWTINSRDMKKKKKPSKTLYDNHISEPVTQRKVIIRMIRKYSQP